MLNEGYNIALVSDAGFLISDPGYELVVAAHSYDIHVETVPGPNAGLTALMASGLPSYTYTFLGFLPRKEKDKVAVLQERMFQDSTLIIYESPFRVVETLKAISKVDDTRRVAVGRELTKKFEQIMMQEVEHLINAFQNDEIMQKGEFVILIEGAKPLETEQWFQSLTISEHVEHYISEQNIKPKKAIKLVAEDRHMKTGEVYDIYHDVNQ